MLDAFGGQSDGTTRLASRSLDLDAWTRDR